jgi:intein-encoded DNA endonuclease-like protein
MEAVEASYLAGFLDGDGSIHFQLVRQTEYRFGYYIRATVSLSQRTSARQGLERIHEMVGAGYVRDRGTGMSDLVITSRPVLIWLLTAVHPYVIFKARHVAEALKILGRIRPRMEPQEFLQLAREIDCFSALNYSKTKRISAADVEQHLRSMGVSSPVTTPRLSLEARDGMHHRTVKLGIP